MDEELKELMDLSIKRGSRYVKGEAGIDDFALRTAELGVFLLSAGKRASIFKGEALRQEFTEIQNRIDDYRKFIFKKRIEIL